MIILLGGSGYIGQAFRQALAARGATFRSISRSDCDYYDVETLGELLQQTGASLVINAAGFTGKPNVDACERQRAETLFGNAVLPGRVRAACEAAGVALGHVSSGCIFSGSRDDGQGFDETDEPNFCFRSNDCSFYSGSKALGEEVLQGMAECYIWRVRIPFSHVDSPRNYLSKLMRYDRLLDVRNSLSHLEDFVDACLHCVEHQLPFGIFNLTNAGSVTTRDVVELIRKHGVSDREFRFFASEAEFMQKAAIAPRSNCVLDVSKALRLGIPLPDVHEALERALRDWSPAPVGI